MSGFHQYIEELTSKDPNLKIKDYWITKDKRKIKLNNLTDVHIVNIYKKLMAKNLQLPPLISEEIRKRKLYSKIFDHRDRILIQLLDKIEELENKINL